MSAAGWMPVDESSTKGWTPVDEETQFEKQNKAKDTTGGAGPVARTAYGIGRGLNNLVEGTYQTVMHPVDTASNIATQFENIPAAVRAANQEPSTIGKIAGYGAAVPLLGSLGKNLGERAAGGDYAGAVAEGVATAAGPSAAKEIAPRLPNPREAVGRRMYTPEGALKPAVHLASKVAAGAAGEATGIPYGGLAGWLSGPEIAKTAFPNPSRYPEMAKSAQYRDMARSAAKGSPEPYPGVENASSATETPAAGISESRPTNTESFLTNLVKKPIWTPEDFSDAQKAFGPDGALRPGEGQTQYRARLMGMIRSSRAAQGMTDIESYPAPQRKR